MPGEECAADPRRIFLRKYALWQTGAIRRSSLPGIHLSSYGTDFKEQNEEDLLSLIRSVHEVPGIRRIRLGSLEPRIITEEFMEGISSLPKVCPHFHLSLQSGCDRTLRNMNRKYTAAEYEEKCALIRRYYDMPALTTDVIVGFPQETEEDFLESCEFVSGIHFYETHIFKYSRRQGTKAAAMDGQLTEAVKARRSDRLLELNEQRQTEFESAMAGRKLEILLEEETEIDGKTYFLGHSREYVKTAVEKTDALKVNDLITAVEQNTEKTIFCLWNRRPEGAGDRHGRFFLYFPERYIRIILINYVRT